MLAELDFQIKDNHRLTAENAKLLEERDRYKAMYEHVHVTDCELHRVRAAWKRDREQNAKLREVVDGLREYIAGNADDCDFCPQLATCENHPAPPPCKYELTTKDNAVLDYIANSLRELGIEVPE